MEAIKGGQLVDPLMEKLKHRVLKDKRSNFFILEDRVLGYKGGCICVPSDEEIKKQIMYEAHNTRYMMHPIMTKMYKELKSQFWWPSMKKDVVDCVARCFDLPTNKS